MRVPIEITEAETVEWTAQPSSALEIIAVSSHPSDSGLTVTVVGTNDSPQSDVITLRGLNGPGIGVDTFTEVYQATVSAAPTGEVRLLLNNGTKATGSIQVLSQPSGPTSLTLGPVSGVGSRTYTLKRGERSTVQTVADSPANNLDGKYFDIYDGANAVRVWFNTSGGGASAPATPSGGRLIEVAVTTGDSANTVATLLAAAFNADSLFFAEASTNSVAVFLLKFGNVTDIAPGTSGFTVSVSVQGTDNADEVMVGKTIYETARNLASAINDDTGEGTRYGTGTTVHAEVSAYAEASYADTTLNGTSEFVVYLRDKYALARTNGWDCYLSGSAGSMATLPPSGGADGTLLATIPPGSTQVGAAVSLDNEDLSTTNFPATLTPTFDVIRVGGGPARVSVFRHASDANVAFLVKAGISPTLCTTTIGTITANGATPVVSDLIQGYEYLLISVSTNSNSSPARVAGYVVFQP